MKTIIERLEEIEKHIFSTSKAEFEAFGNAVKGDFEALVTRVEALEKQLTAPLAPATTL